MKKGNIMLQDAQIIKERLTKQGRTLSTAESCTSGRIAACLTRISGASNYFQGGLIAYQNHLKTKFLDVEPEDIERYDVVSQPVVEQMVRGACQFFHTDYALASTGYAGDGANGIPAGTIWIAWGTATDVHSRCLTTDNGREANTQNAVAQVLREFVEYLGS